MFNLYNITGNEMSQFYKRELDNGQTVYFSLVNKQSERGFTTNKRLFLMLENQFICYLSSPKVDFPLTIDYISKHAKLTILLKQITKLTFKPQKNAINIQFWILEEGKRRQKQWILELGSASLMNAWQDNFQEFSNRSRRGTAQNTNPIEGINNVNANIGEVEGKIVSQQNRAAAQLKSTHQQALEQELATSEFLLKDDREYFNIGVIQPSPSKNYPEEYLRRTQNFQLSKLKDRKDYFTKYSGYSSKMYSFTNYYRPYIDDIIAIQNAFLRASQLEQADRKYTQFIQYAQQQVVNLIDYHLQRVVEVQRVRIARQSGSDKPGIIRYTQIQDIIVQFGFVQLKQISNNAFICDDILNKLVLKSFKNLQYLFQIISKQQILKSAFFIPMACIINFKGYECVVYSKIDPTIDEQYENYSENHGLAAPTLFNILSQATRINIQIFQDESNVKIIPRNIKREKFAIVSANCLLPELQASTLLRRQTFCAVFNTYTKQIYSKVGNKSQLQYQNAKIYEQLQTKQRQLSTFLNKLQIYPISPQQTALIFHNFGVNLKYLARICNSISQSYILSVLKAEAALRVFKTIYRKKIQDNLMESNNPPIQYTTKQFLNLLLGNEEGTLQLWKVISLHTQKYFNLHVQMAQVNKGYFLLGLNYHLSAQIYPSTSNIDNIFRTNSFVQGVKFYSKVKAANILPSFMRQIKDEIEISMNHQTFKWLVDVFWLKQKYFPKYIQDHANLYSKLLYMCSFYIKPNDQNYLHLKLYEMVSPNEQVKIQQFNLHFLRKKLTQVRWYIKSQSPKQHIMVLIAKLKQIVQNFYGKHHPFISQIYQLQSLYHLQIHQKEEAININKQSLTNTIKCCGNNTKHIKISNNYYQMAECLLKCHRVEQCLSNYKKAMNILDMNSYQELPEYAHILYKIGVVTLHLNKDSESYDLFVQALRIYENNSIYANWAEIVDLYQLISRCQFKAGSRLSFIPKQIKLAQHIVQLLQKTQIMELQFQVCSDIHFIRMLKIVIQTYLSKIKSEDMGFFRDYIIDYCDYLTVEEQPYTDEDLRNAILYFKNLIAVGNLLPTLQNYISNTGQIMARIKNEKLLEQVRVFRRNDFLQGYQQFIRQLIELLGEAFLLNILK